MTQCEKILSYMERYGSITPLEALDNFGCLRLSARILDLKSEGHRISADRETKKNRFGEQVSYCRYRLEGRP